MQLALALVGATLCPQRADPPAEPPLVPCSRRMETGAGKVHDVDVSADGARVLVGCDNGHVLVYGLETGALLEDLNAGPGPVMDVEFDSQGDRLLAVQFSGAHVWSARTFELLYTLSGQKLGMLTGSFSPDGSRIATGSCGSGAEPNAATEARVWDSASGACVLTIDCVGWRVRAAFRPDGRAVLVSTQASSDAFVRRLDDLHLPPKSLTGHSGVIAASAWSPDGELALTVGSDFTGRAWDPRTGREQHVLRGHTGYMIGCEFAPDGRELSTTSWADRTTRIWSVRTGKERLVLVGHQDRPTLAHFAPRGGVFASVDAAGLGLVFELERGKAVGRLVGHAGIVSSLAFSPDERYIVTGGFDGTVRVWCNPLAN